jgi:hypothetical protein
VEEYVSLLFASCPPRIEMAIGRLKGVIRVDSNYLTGKVVVQYNAATVRWCKLKGLDARVQPAWFQRLKLKFEKTSFEFCFQCQLAALRHGGRAQHQSRDRVAGIHGRAVQVDPIKPTLKAPGTMPLTLKYDILLSNSAFNSNLCCYHTAELWSDTDSTAGSSTGHTREAGASLSGST